MSHLEQNLIECFLQNQTKFRKDVVCGSGDDAAVVNLPVGYSLVSTVDSQVSGTHFDDRFSAKDLGYKALAVNLSDIAAMGAKPCWALVSLTLENADDVWVSEFSSGFYALANKYNIECIGGNIATGPLAVHVTLFGLVLNEQELRQSQAKIHDNIIVLGKMGGAAWAWQNHRPKNTAEFSAYLDWQRPSIAVDFAQEVSCYANAAIDVSDGLYPDLRRLLDKSALGAELFLDECPYHEVLEGLSKQSASDLAWMGGESYQLCLTCSGDNVDKVLNLAKQYSLKASVVGKVIESGIVWQKSNIRPEPKEVVYQHFTGKKHD